MKKIIFTIVFFLNIVPYIHDGRLYLAGPEYTFAQTNDAGSEQDTVKVTVPEVHVCARTTIEVVYEDDTMIVIETCHPSYDCDTGEDIPGEEDCHDETIMLPPPPPPDPQDTTQTPPDTTQIPQPPPVCGTCLPPNPCDANALPPGGTSTSQIIPLPTGAETLTTETVSYADAVAALSYLSTVSANDGNIQVGAISSAVGLANTWLGIGTGFIVGGVYTSNSNKWGDILAKLALSNCRVVHISIVSTNGNLYNFVTYSFSLGDGTSLGWVIY